MIGAQWGREATDALAGACVLGPSWNDAARAAGARSRKTVLERRQNLIGKHMIARIAVPAALAWLDAHAGSARAAGRVEAKDADPGNGGTHRRPPFRARDEHPRPSGWPATSGGQPRPSRSALRARAGAPARAAPSSRGAAAGPATPKQARSPGTRSAICEHRSTPRRGARWSARSKATSSPIAAPHPALAATSALVRTMLEQTGRNHVARGPDGRTLCALEVPRRLWRALGEAGPCPGDTPEPDLTERWWLVEIEAPPDDEPNAIALWESEGAQIVLAAFLHPRERDQAPFVTVVTWRTRRQRGP